MLVVAKLLTSAAPRPLLFPLTARRFVLVDDAGAPLATGTPIGDALPPLRERQKNYRAVQGSKYATAADQLGDATAPPEQ